MRLIPASATLGFALVSFGPPAQAHKPSYGGTDLYGSVEDPYVVDDIDVSIVVYHQVTCRSEQLWLEVEALEDETPLYVQLGVPVIDRLTEYRPSLAVLAPGLPAPTGELPFEVPQGFGALVFDTAEVAEPDSFYEPFSQTDSWVLHEDTIPVPAGVSYVVAWHPEHRTGKLWVASGTVEDFGPEDFAQFGDWMTQTKTFHEVAPYVPIEEPTETICAEPGLDLPAQGERDDVGCSHSPSGTGPLGLLLAAGLLGLRRRYARRESPNP
jgi:MYXO-CTERM domain-containing protein